MKRATKFGVVLLIAMLLIGLTGPALGIAATPSAGEPINVLIGFEKKSDVDLVKRFGGKVQKEFSLVPVIAARMPDAAARALAKNPNVKYVEPDFAVQALQQTVPWGIKRVFGPESYSFATWSKSKGGGIKVAVLDTGIDQSHEDLRVVGGTNTIDSTFWGTDGYGHGTHVAGAIAAADNSLGVVGVSPQSDLYAVKVLDSSGSGSVASVIAGIQWAVGQGIPIMNMSLGSSSYSQALKDACDIAYAKGHLLVASAGNSGNAAGSKDTLSYPAKYSSVIAVAASDSSDKRATWSSTGPDVELIAPGVSILSTLPGDKYGTMSGTSMASPHVAGIAALVWAANPDLNNAGVREILRTTAENLGLSVTHQGYGLARADLAVAKAYKAPPAATGSIEGVVSNSAGLVIAGAVVNIEGTEISKTTDASGNYRIDGIPVGEYRLYAAAAGYYPESTVVQVVKDTISTQNFILREIPTYTVSGVATDSASGGVIAGATVTVQETGQFATTGADGSYAIAGLNAGTYSIGASKEGYVNQTKTVVVSTDTIVDFALVKIEEPTVEAMHVSSITFAEKRYGRNGSSVDLIITVEVLRSRDGQPVSGANVRMNLAGNGSVDLIGDTKDDGKVIFTVKRVATGAYNATVTGLSHGVLVWDSSQGVTSAVHSVK